MINDKWRPKITQIESSKKFNYGVDKKKHGFWYDKMIERNTYGWTWLISTLK